MIYSSGEQAYEGRLQCKHAHSPNSTKRFRDLLLFKLQALRPAWYSRRAVPAMVACCSRRLAGRPDDQQNQPDLTYPEHEKKQGSHKAMAVHLHPRSPGC